MTRRHKVMFWLGSSVLFYVLTEKLLGLVGR